MKVNDIDMDAVILGNGEYPTHSMPETMLIMAPYVVCCDGSADEHIRRGFTPDAIIGDGDSLSPENKERFRTIFHQIDDQETNDQTKAVHFLLDQGKKTIILVGATGKRDVVNCALSKSLFWNESVSIKTIALGFRFFTFTFSAAGFIATSTSALSPGVKILRDPR